jgi:hypothetical protein
MHGPTCIFWADLTAFSRQGPAQQTLLYGWAWLLAVAELMVGLPAAALGTTMDFSAARGGTSVTGIAARDGPGGALYALISVFGPSCYNASSALVPITLTVRTARGV